MVNVKESWIDIWKWDWDLYPKLILKGRDVPSFSLDIMVAMTPWQEISASASQTLHNWLSSFPSNTCRLHSSSHPPILLESENCCWYEVIVLLETTPRLHPFRLRQCAYLWKGFRQTCYQRLSHPSFLFFLTKQSKVCFCFCKNHI